jgi:hypothetical protein
VSENKFVAPKDNRDWQKVSALRRDFEAWRKRLDHLSLAQSVLLAVAGSPKIGGEVRVQRVTRAARDAWPEDTVAAYILLLDRGRHLRLVQEVPVSQSGDWYVEDEHLFDVRGRTVAFGRHRSFFGIYCGENEAREPTREMFVAFYDGQRLIARDYRLEDRDGATPDREKCSFMQFPWAVDATVEAFLQRRGLTDAARAAGVLW